MVVDDGAPLPKVTKLFGETLFPSDPAAEREERMHRLRATVERLVELLAISKADGAVPLELAAEIEEPLQRLQTHLKPPRRRREKEAA
jgi:hypothetical protein